MYKFEPRNLVEVLDFAFFSEQGKVRILCHSDRITQAKPHEKHQSFSKLETTTLGTWQKEYKIIWDFYCNKIEGKNNLNVSLKQSNQLEEAIIAFIGIIRNVAEQAASQQTKQGNVALISVKIKTLIAEDRNSRSDGSTRRLQ